MITAHKRVTRSVLYKMRTCLATRISSPTYTSMYKLNLPILSYSQGIKRLEGTQSNSPLLEEITGNNE